MSTPAAAPVRRESTIRGMRWAARVLDAACAIAMWFALPLVLLLFAQWPLRDVVGAYSRQANDLAQCVFALYVAFALQQATRYGAHLRADAWARRWPAAWQRAAQRWLPLASTLPWSVFVLWSSTPMVWESLRSLEGFPDTYNPGYFVIKLALWLLAAAMALQSVLHCAGASQAGETTA